ncbi:MAG: cupin domain-containing protein [Terracidiphilus sp.]|jgi:quercetin dioxygenase-like cupin family protein
MKILSSNDRASRKGLSDWFTGNVWLDEIAVGVEPSRLSFFRVSFEPGARTAWHTHPVGQTLHILTGSGLVQLEGQKVQEIHPGDTVVIAPNERHWHGASASNTMVHLAIQEMDDQGVNVVWMEKVTDEEYSAK